MTTAISRIWSHFSAFGFFLLVSFMSLNNEFLLIHSPNHGKQHKGFVIANSTFLEKSFRHQQKNGDHQIPFDEPSWNLCNEIFKKDLTHRLSTMLQHLLVQKSNITDFYGVYFLNNLHNKNQEYLSEIIVLQPHFPLNDTVKLPVSVQCLYENNVLVSPLYDIIRISPSLVVSQVFSFDKMLRVVKESVCTNHQNLFSSNHSSHTYHLAKNQDYKPRIFRQYVLFALMSTTKTEFFLWSVLISYERNSYSKVLWNSLTQEHDANFAQRPSIFSVIKKANLSSLNSIYGSFRAHNFQFPKVMRYFPFRSQKKTYAVELLGESFVPINPEIPFLFRLNYTPTFARYPIWFLIALRSFINNETVGHAPLIPFTSPDWVRPIYTEEELVYRFLSRNFKEKTLQNFLLNSSNMAVHSPISSTYNENTTLQQSCVTEITCTKSKNTSIRQHNHRDSWNTPRSQFFLTESSNISTKFKNGYYDSTGQINLIQKPKVYGLIDFTNVSLNIVFPVYKMASSFSVPVVDLHGLYLPKKLFSPISVIATSFTNRSPQQALAILIKKFCSTYSINGVCSFPCYPRKWKSYCSVGEPFNITSQKKIKFNNNWFIPFASFCDKSNPFLSQYRNVSLHCSESGFDPSISIEDRVRIPNCDTIVGTGDSDECRTIINELLLKSIVPTSKDVFFNSRLTPYDIGQFATTKDPLYITGDTVLTPLFLFLKIRNNISQRGGIPQNTSILNHYSTLREAMDYFCVENSTFPEQSENNTRNLANSNFDHCFISCYLYQLLSSLGVTSKGPDIYIPNQPTNTSQIHPNIDVVRGSILHTLLDSRFVTDISFYKSNFW